MGSRSARGRQARVAGLARLARPLVVEVVTAPAARARLVDAAEDLALGRAHVRGLVPVLRRDRAGTRVYWDDDYEWDDGNEFAGTKYDDETVAHIQSTAHPKEPKEPRTIGDPGAGGIFVIVLQSVVYLIGLVFCCGGLTYVVVQKNSGKSVWSAVPTLDPATLDPKSSVQMKKLAVTPDTTYSGSA